MITYYVGVTGSSLGGPTQGITFSSNGIQVNGITGGCYPIFGTYFYSGDWDYLGTPEYIEVEVNPTGGYYFDKIIKCPYINY